VIRTRVTASTAALVLILVSTVLRLAAAQSVGLGVSEAYYFGAARHVSLSYFDHPPAAAFLAWLSLYVTGEISNLILRLPFVALFSATTWLMFLTGRRLFGPWAGFLSALLLNITPVFALSAGMFFQPDGPLMFFWLATVYFLVPLLVDDRGTPPARRAWILAGVMLGLALLSKYTAVFLVSGALCWMLVGRDRRRWLVRPEPYLALAVAVVFFMPVLVWNAGHDWISFRWQAARATAYEGFRFSWLLHNVGGQIVELSPWIWVLLVLEPFRARRSPADQVRGRRFLLCLGLPPILAYTAVAAYADVGNHFHWGTPGYLTLLLGLGATLDGWFRHRARLATAVTVGLSAASILIMVVVNVQAATGRFSSGDDAVSRWLRDGNDPTIELLDYDALRAAFDARGLLRRPDLFVFSDRHYVAGKVDYALKGQLPFLLLSDDPRAYAFFDDPTRWVGYEGILVSQRGSLAAVEADYADYCSAIDVLEPVPIERRGIVELTLYLYRCTQLTKPFPLPYG
jgi:4-amino-4-deoxy-L-arabinose transferase-like glycosyltransferase